MSLLNYTFYPKKNVKTLVLLHGYLENLKMWDNYVLKLKEKYQIVVIDLPGHGKSPTYNAIHTMNFMAKKTVEVLDFLELKKAIFIGHSMGGYVLLSLLKNQENYIEKFCLFFSSPFDDDETRKENRIRAIEIAKKHRETYIHFSIPLLFDQNNLDNLKNEIQFAQNLALETPLNGITSALLGLRERENLVELFNQTQISSILISGEFDNAVSLEKLKNELIFNRTKEHFVLPIGHMGHLEAENECLQIIENFLEK